MKNPKYEARKIEPSAYDQVFEISLNQFQFLMLKINPYTLLRQKIFCSNSSSLSRFLSQGRNLFDKKCNSGHMVVKKFLETKFSPKTSCAQKHFGTF